jgi:hypothetical protein
MSLKQRIKEQKIMRSGAVDMQLELPGEPVPYSIKYAVGTKNQAAVFFRRPKFTSILKCFFRAQYNTKTPLVLIITFYVAPPENVQITAKELKGEKVPATKGFEICDYLLTFLEIGRKVIFNTHAQFCKIDAEKYYSDKPRTVIQFMTWYQYECFKNDPSLHPKAQSVCKIGSPTLVQSIE